MGRVMPVMSASWKASMPMSWRLHLAGDGHHGHAVHVGVGDAGDQVGGARTRGGQADPHLARGAGVAVGRVAGALLVAARGRG